MSFRKLGSRWALSEITLNPAAQDWQEMLHCKGSSSFWQNAILLHAGVSTKNRPGLWVTVPNQVGTEIKVCLLNCYCWYTNKPTPTLPCIRTTSTEQVWGNAGLETQDLFSKQNRVSVKERWSTWVFYLWRQPITADVNRRRKSNGSFIWHKRY